jgi:RHS repeat-associated protein
MTTTAESSENSHHGFEVAKRMLCLAAMQVKSNTASGMPVCLRRNGMGSRSSSKERDVETGLDFFGARYYSGAQGRFVSPDPGAYKLENPQTFNRYSYVNNNPLKYVDPSGREATWAINDNEMTLTLFVNITIWGPGANDEYARFLGKQIEGAWKGKFKNTKTGKEYKFATVADVSVYGTDGAGLTAPNGFYVGNDVLQSNFRNKGVDNTFAKRFSSDPGMYTGALNPKHGDEEHEGGHVLGLGEDYERYYEEGQLKSRSLPGHEGHLMSNGQSHVAAQDEIDRLGNYAFGQREATHKSTGTIIRLPEPPKPK